MKHRFCFEYLSCQTFLATWRHQCLSAQTFMTVGMAREASLLLRISELSDLLGGAACTNVWRSEVRDGRTGTRDAVVASNIWTVRRSRQDGSQRCLRPDTHGSIAVAREASLLLRMSGYTISAHRSQLNYTDNTSDFAAVPADIGVFHSAPISMISGRRL